MKQFYLGLCLFILLGNQCLLAGLNDGLVAFYPFNGNANDASGNGNNGIVYGATLTTDRFGNANAAYDFNGSSSYIDIPQNSGLNNLTANFTLSAWIYQRSINPNYGYRILDKCPAGIPGGWTFDTWDGSSYRRLRLQAAGSYNPNVIGATFYSLMQWHHVVATVSGTTGKVYLDGNLDGSGDVGSIPQNMLDVFIGRAHIGCGGGCGIEEFFNGLIDDVRIYNRALSASEIQQLYSLSDIGTAPTPPAVVQTNRTPSSAELGTQISGNFKVFTNRNFKGGVALDPSKLTIVLTHGWNSSSDDWPSNMASQFVAAGISANIVAWDWRDDAKQVWPQTALLKTPAQGLLLGTILLQNLGAGYNQPIHFIGHSFGTEVNAAAANYLESNGYSWANIQMTLLDEAEIGNDLRIVSPTTWNLGWIKPLPNNFAWSDNYVSLAGELQDNPNNVNIILTEGQPGTFYISADDLWNDMVAYHAVPYQWYGQTISNPAGSVMGDIWSFERNSNFTSPAGETYFEQQGSSLVLNQIPQAIAEYLRQVNSISFYRDLGVLLTLKGVNATVQVVGDVTANVIETALTDPNPVFQTTPATIGISTYAPAAPDFWSPQLILQNHPLNLPPNLKSLNAHPLDNPSAHVVEFSGVCLAADDHSNKYHFAVVRFHASR